MTPLLAGRGARLAHEAAPAAEAPLSAWRGIRRGRSADRLAVHRAEQGGYRLVDRGHTGRGGEGALADAEGRADVTGRPVAAARWTERGGAIFLLPLLRPVAPATFAPCRLLARCLLHQGAGRPATLDHMSSRARNRRAAVFEETCYRHCRSAVIEVGHPAHEHQDLRSSESGRCQPPPASTLNISSVSARPRLCSTSAFSVLGLPAVDLPSLLAVRRIRPKRRTVRRAQASSMSPRSCAGRR